MAVECNWPATRRALLGRRWSVACGSRRCNFRKSKVVRSPAGLRHRQYILPLIGANCPSPAVKSGSGLRQADSVHSSVPLEHGAFRPFFRTHPAGRGPSIDAGALISSTAVGRQAMQPTLWRAGFRPPPKQGSSRQKPGEGPFASRCRCFPGSWPIDAQTSAYMRGACTAPRQATVYGFGFKLPGWQKKRPRSQGPGLLQATAENSGWKSQLKRRFPAHFSPPSRARYFFKQQKR